MSKDNIKKCLKLSTSGIGIRKYFYSQLGVAHSVLTDYQKKLGVCVLDIGAGTTDISVYQNGTITFSKVLPYAGDYITEIIASALDIQSSDAEAIKKKYGSAFSDNINDEILKISVENGKKSISRKALAGLIENPMSKILRHCLDSLEENNLLNNIWALNDPTGAFLFGTFQEELDDIPCVYGTLKPVETWNPIWINFQHLWCLIQDAWYTNSLKDKFRIWFMPTGWRPEDVTKKIPRTKVENVYNQEKYKPEYKLIHKIFAGFHFVVQNIILFVFLTSFSDKA